MKRSTLRNITPVVRRKVNRQFGGTCLHNAPFASCLAYTSTVKMEASCTSETSVDFQRATRRSMPGDITVELVEGFFSFHAPPPPRLKSSLLAHILSVRFLIFLIYLILRAALGPWVYSASNRNEYQKQKNGPRE
jgi:hypothetical protein